MRVLIVGAGQAGVAAAFAVREALPSADVTLLGEEREAPYERPPLSKGLFGAGGPELRGLRSREAWEASGIDLRLGWRATHIDRAARRVTAAPLGEPGAGSALPYDYLVLATGMRARPLAGGGGEPNGACDPQAAAPGAGDDSSAGPRTVPPMRLRTVLDARRLAEAGPRSLGVVGSGFLGVEAARAAADAGLEATLYLRGDVPLQGRVSPTLAAYLAGAHAAAGVRIVPRAGVSDARDPRLAAHDVVLAAVGASPADALLRDAGLSAGVDAQLRTADPRIFAIGDLAEAPAWRSRGLERQEAENPARLHGEFVGRALAALAQGAPVEPFDEVPWHWSLQGPIRVLIAGAFAGGAEAPEFAPEAGAKDVVIGSPERGAFQVLRFQGEELRVVETVGAPAPHAVARRLLAAGTLPTPAQAREPGFALKAFARTVG